MTTRYLHEATADFRAWLSGGGWVLLAMCALVLAFAVAVFATTDEPGDRPDGDDRTAPPVDLDTELRRLLDDERRRS